MGCAGSKPDVEDPKKIVKGSTPGKSATAEQKLSPDGKVISSAHANSPGRSGEEQKWDGEEPKSSTTRLQFAVSPGRPEGTDVHSMPSIG